MRDMAVCTINIYAPLKNVGASFNGAYVFVQNHSNSSTGSPLKPKRTCK